MQIIRNIESMPPVPQGSMVTIGNFDGIHLGHLAIFKRLVSEAKRTSRSSVVITFDPHPQKVLHPEKRPFSMLTTLEEKIAHLQSLNIDTLIIITFTKEFSKKTPEEFVRSILLTGLNMKKIFIGYDNAFGKNKSGDADSLREMGTVMDFETEEIGVVMLDSHVVSSTNIRIAITEGNLSVAERMLGRPYAFSGIVVRGHRRGSDIGIPTANIETEKVIPASGVYAIEATVMDETQRGVLNIGFNPTFGNKNRSVEVHLFDFDKNLYGKPISITFIERLREEIKFDSPWMLVEQIRKDIKKAKSILASKS